MSATPTLRHAGACHCGAVRFEVEAPAEVEVLTCNCSICARTGYLHLIVDRDRLHLLQGAEVLADYRFGTGTARHHFCRICGVKPFYVPRSKPDGYSVNLRCVDRRGLRRVDVVAFDGRDWEAAFAARGEGGDAR
ncbi:MAG: GFA family protein [Nannocystaceae bacterium]